MASNETTTNDAAARKTRIKKLKRTIVAVVAILILLPTVLCIVLFVSLTGVKRELKEARAEMNAVIASTVYDISDGTVNVPMNPPGLETPSSYAQRTDMEPAHNYDVEPYVLSKDEVDELTLSNEELYEGYRKVYLTFDDGPSGITNDILDVLAKYDVKATFFVNYRTGEYCEDIYRRIADEGHTLGMHSCSHVYSEIYASEEAFVEDTEKLRDYLFLVTGVDSRFYRFPGGSSNRATKQDMHVLAKVLADYGIQYFDWNISAGDAETPALSSTEIYNRVVSKLGEFDESIILFHDLSSKEATLSALPGIIEYIQNMDRTVILPITEGTNPIQHLSLDK